MDDDRILYSDNEARRLLGNIGRSKYLQEVDAGELERVHIGKRAFVTAESLRRYVERLRSQERAR
jgi:hypothetical protein